jgi:hypothetical protein
LRNSSGLCDGAVVCLCNATQAEENLVREYGYDFYHDDREWGKSQPDIKTALLKQILALRPDYILVLDADETVPTLTRPILENLAETHESCQFYVVNLWNDENHYRKTMAFWNVRAYNPNASPDHQFLRKPVHCGNAPPYFYSQSAKASYVPHILLHKGLMDGQIRKAKVGRYNLYDPQAIYKGEQYYEALTHDVEGAEYVEQDIVNKITDYCKVIGAI